MRAELQSKTEKQQAVKAPEQDIDIMQMAKVVGNQAVIQFDSYYAYGQANSLPHIHCYGGGFHLKDSDGSRYNLVQHNVKYPTKIYEAYEWIRNVCPERHKEPLLEVLRELFRGEYSDAKPTADYKPFKSTKL